MVVSMLRRSIGRRTIYPKLGGAIAWPIGNTRPNTRVSGHGIEASCGCLKLHWRLVSVGPREDVSRSMTIGQQHPNARSFDAIGRSFDKR